VGSRGRRNVIEALNGSVAELWVIERPQAHQGRRCRIKRCRSPGYRWHGAANDFAAARLARVGALEIARRDRSRAGSRPPPGSAVPGPCGLLSRTVLVPSAVMVVAPSPRRAG